MYTKSIQKAALCIFSLFFITGFIASFLSQDVQAATADGVFSIQVPNSGNLIQGCTYSADIRVNTGSNTSNAADIIVLFDPTKIEIVDSNLTQSSPTLKQIAPGPAYEAYPANGNRVDEGSGTIRLSGISFGNNLNGNEVFASIQFRSKPSAVNGNFTIKFDGVGNTLDSNIADFTTSTDILGSKIDAAMNFSPGSCISDTTPPNVTFSNPTNNQRGVPVDQNITMSLSDNLSGVNINTLEIIVNGVSYNATNPRINIIGNPNSYTITLDPTDPFYPNGPSNIVVRVLDFAGNLRQSSIAFNYPPLPTAPTIPPTPTVVIPVPDLSSPTITFINPIPNETISSNETIIVNVKDEGTGINLNNLVLFVNDKKYLITDSAVRYSGDQNNYQISITDNFRFSNVSSSYFSVFVTDLSGNSASGNIIFNIPDNVVNEDNPKPCPAVEPITCGTDAPFLDEVSGVQDAITELAPENIKPVLENAGFLGIASLVALLPLAVQILLTLGGLLAGGFLWPFLYALIIPAHKKLGSVIDEYTREGLSFVKITVIEKTTGKVVRKAFTDFSGKYFLHLDPGQYLFHLEKKNYVNVDFETPINDSKDIDFLFAMSVKESADLGTQVQLKVFKVNPVFITSIIATLISAINLIYVRTITAILLFVVILIITFVISYRTLSKKTAILPRIKNS